MTKRTDDIDYIYGQMMMRFGPEKECASEPKEVLPVQTPSQIKAELDKYVIGQDRAKKLLAVAGYNRLLALSNTEQGRGEDYHFEKNNITLIGGTGCGKTHLMRNLAKTMNIPLVIGDATSLTAAGYVGGDVKDLVNALVMEAERGLGIELKDKKIVGFGTKRIPDDLVRQRVEHGIIFVDEIDKIKISDTNGKDVNGKSVQEALLKMIEGTKLQARGNQFIGTIDTTGILFVIGGAFSGLKEQLEAKHKVDSTSIGFTTNDPGEFNYAEYRIKPEDLVDFGIIPELIGRSATIAQLHDLDHDTLKRIFIEPKDALLGQFRNQFKSYGMDVKLTDRAIDEIVTEAEKLELGARGLRIIAEQYLNHYQYTLPDTPEDEKSETVVITKEMLIRGKDL